MKRKKSTKHYQFLHLSFWCHFKKNLCVCFLKKNKTKKKKERDKKKEQEEEEVIYLTLEAHRNYQPKR